MDRRTPPAALAVRAADAPGRWPAHAAAAGPSPAGPWSCQGQARPVSKVCGLCCSRCERQLTGAACRPAWHCLGHRIHAVVGCSPAAAVPAVVPSLPGTVKWTNIESMHTCMCNTVMRECTCGEIPLEGAAAAVETKQTRFQAGGTVSPPADILLRKPSSPLVLFSLSACLSVYLYVYLTACVSHRALIGV